jgi:hypothetical protein
MTSSLISEILDNLSSLIVSLSLEIETRLIDEKFANVMGEYVT